jgi:hypothetical protein
VPTILSACPALNSHFKQPRIHYPHTRQRVPAAQVAPEACFDHAPPEMKKGRREGRELAAPMAACNKARGSHHRFSRDIPALPARWFYAYTYSPWCAGLVGHHCPCDAKHHHDRDTSVGVSGRYDFTSASSAVRLTAPMRPPQPAPTYRDDAYAPFDGAGWRQIIIISDKTQQEYFSQTDWTAQSP